MKKITLIFALFFIAQFAKAQDTCGSALPINSAGLYVVDAVNGTDVPSPICAPNGTGATAGEWYAYTPTADHTVTLTSNIVENTPRKDTRVHVYTGACGALTCLAGDDDSGSNFSSVCIFNVVANTTYYIAWDNKWNSSGFTFQLIEGNVIVPPVTPITYTTQTISTISSTYNICIADMNGDNLDDIVGVSANNLKINFQGTTPNSFIANDFPITGTSMMPSWSMAAGDVNKDGYNDVVLGNGQGLSVWSSNSTGTAYSNYTPGQYIFCQRTNFADLNNDGNLDVFSCHDVAPNVYYLNDGNNNLTYYQSNTTPGAMNLDAGGGNDATLFTDFDNDGDSDVFISKCSGPPCQLFRYDGGNNYTNVSATVGINITPIQTWSSAISDFDNDGDMDIIITASSGAHHFFRNNFETTHTLSAFTEITSGSGWDTNSNTNIDNIAYDFDNNGYVDVLGGGNKIMFNQGNNIFAPISYSGISVGAVGDLNNDGFLDIQNGSTIRYAVPNGNNWIKIVTKGTISNSNGIGARVELYGTWGKQIRDIRSGEGFKYMSSMTAHFGIGTATEIVKVVIKWPSGKVDTILNPNINQTLVVVENTTNLATNNFSDSEFSISPNPAKSVINISVKNAIELKIAEIYDIKGRLVLSSELTTNSINVESLVKGTYILVLRETNGKSNSEKFIKE